MWARWSVVVFGLGAVAATPTKAPGAGVRGVVVGPHGAPIEGATVRVLLPGGADELRGTPTAKTNATGDFEIGGLPNGPLSVVVTHPDFAPTSGASSPMTWPPTTAQLRLEMTPGARLEGVVLQKHGTPLGGMRVAVQAVGQDGAPMSLPPTSTLEDGTFSLDHVPAGPALDVRVTDERGKIVMDAERIPENTVREGDVATVTFRRDLVRVSGRLSRSGAPLPRAALRWGDTHGPPPAQDAFAASMSVTNEDGLFELFLRPGSWPLLLASLDGRRLYGRRTIVVPDADDSRVDIAIPGGETVSGRVIDRATGKGIERALVDIRPPSGKLKDRVRVLSREDGRFDLDLEPADYVVRVTAFGYHPAEVPVGVFGSAPPDLRLELVRAAQIRGRVVGCDGSTCNVTIRSQDGRVASEILYDGDGGYHTGALADESYNLCAGSEEVGWAVLTSVQAGMDDVTLTIRPPGNVVLSILGPDGKPVAGAFPVVRSVEGGQVGVPYNFYKRASDDAGRLEYLVPAGALEIDLLSQKYKGRITVQVEPGATVTRQVTLTEPSGLGH